MSNINSLTPQVQINTQQTSSVRQTTNDSVGAKFKQALSATANAVGGAVSMAAPYLPGGNVISAALSGASNLGSSASNLTASSGTNSVSTNSSSSTGGVNIPGQSSLGGTTASSAQDMIAEQQKMNLQMLQLQSQMQNQSQSFNAITNVLKTKHDATMSAVRNAKA